MHFIHREPIYMKFFTCFFGPAILMTIVSCVSPNREENSKAFRNPDDRPNIIWITCEDISPALGCYGDPFASTPNLDRFAEEGILFTNAFANAPICAPARSTLITGIYATSTGTQHLRSEITLPDDLMILPEYLREAGYYCSNNAKTDYNFVAEGRWDEISDTAHWRNRKNEQPFFRVFNFGITHEGHANTINDEDVATLKRKHSQDSANLPPYFPDTPEFRKIWAHQYDLVSVFDQDQFQFLIRQLKEDGLYENTIIFFFSDHGFGLPRYKRWLYRTGLNVPLIIRVPEKYRRSGTSAPGSRDNRLISFVDFAPTVLRLAGLEVPAQMVGNSFLGDQADKPNNYVFGARSRADDVYDVSRCVLDEKYIYIRNFFPHQPYIQDALIFGDQKASFKELRRLKNMGALNPEAQQFWQPKAVEELYDLSKDPMELENLANDPDLRETLKTMRKTLYSWMLETRDMGLFNEAEMMLRSATSSPYELGLTFTEQQFTEILDAAFRCGEEHVTREEILTSLGHSEAAVRYWAVVSFHALGEKDSFVVDALRGALQDPSPSVALAAAELLCQYGRCSDALPVISYILQDVEHPWVVLQAAITSRKIGNKAIPLIPVIEEIFPAYRGEIWNRYKSWSYPMFIGFALDKVYLNCGLELPTG